MSYKPTPIVEDYFNKDGSRYVDNPLDDFVNRDKCVTSEEILQSSKKCDTSHQPNTCRSTQETNRTEIEESAKSYNSYLMRAILEKKFKESAKQRNEIERGFGVI